MSPWASLAVAVATLLATTICLALVRPFLANRQLVDVPNHRSSHTQPTMRGGGLGIAAGLLLGLGFSAFQVAGSSADLGSMGVVGLTVVPLAAVGFAEDVRQMPVSARLISQALIVGVATVGFVLVAGLPVILGLFAGLAGVFYVNAANFMDGVNGISGLHGAAVGAYFAVVGFASKEPGLMLCAVVVGAAFLAFLPWNAPQARMFMGDVGSYTLGGALWALAAWALALGVPPLSAVAPLFVYSADVAFTLVRRAMRRAPLTQAHRDHAYQQVQRITHSHAKAAGLVTAVTVACAFLGLWNLLVPAATLWAAICSAVVLGLFLATPSFLVLRRTLTRPSDGALS